MAARPFTAVVAAFLGRMRAFGVAGEAMAASQAEMLAIFDALAYEFKRLSPYNLPQLANRARPAPCRMMRLALEHIGHNLFGRSNQK